MNSVQITLIYEKEKRISGIRASSEYRDLFPPTIALVVRISSYTKNKSRNAIVNIMRFNTILSVVCENTELRINQLV